MKVSSFTQESHSRLLTPSLLFWKIVFEYDNRKESEEWLLLRGNHHVNVFGRMEIQQQKHIVTPTTGAKVKRVINELEANFNSIRDKESTSAVAVNASHFNHHRKEPTVTHTVHHTNTIPIKTWTSSTPVTTQVHATQTSVPESPRTLSFKTIPVPLIPKPAMNMDSDSSFHEKPVVPLTTVSVSTCPSCGSENVSSTSNGARRSASFQHLTTSKINCNGHNRCDPYAHHRSTSKLLPSMNNVHRSRSFNCNLATSVPVMEPDVSSNSCDCHCKCLVCTGRQTKRQTPNRYTSHYTHLNHHQYQPISNYRRHKQQGKKRKQPSFRHSSVYPLTLDPISLEKQWNSYCCQGCVSSGSNTTTSNLIHPRCSVGGHGVSSYFPLPRKSSSYQLHHDDSLINPNSNHRIWKEKRLNSAGIYRDYRYWDVDEWRAQLKKERAKRKERAALMAVSALGIIIFICVSYFGTLLFLRITKLP